MTIAPGTHLGRYEIRSKLGEGGMGEVYLAHDTVLRRSVAVKVLTADFVQGEERLRRFEREAYSVSSLNHPNIVTIYEIGSEGGINFIATEYVEGESLRQHLSVAHMELRAVIDVAIQVVSALTTAHKAGIVHRDIKPENIMLRRDGYVKVLDFGLAKLADGVASGQADDGEAPTEALIKTEPGRVMGTINYMSPEQARGHKVDARTDIFSLGVTLYEMVAGRRPFAGDSKSDVLAAVLMVEPEPLAKLIPEMPAELNRIVSKLLRKDREERYQTAQELLIDLKSLRQELEFEAKMGRSIMPVPGVAQQKTLTGEVARLPVTARQEDAAPTTISGLFISEVKSHPRGVTLAVAVIALMIGAAGIGLYKLIKLAQRPESFQTMRLTKLTSTGNVGRLGVAVSPDGKYLAYATNESGQHSLWVRHVATSSNVQIVPPAGAGYEGLTFSPDGSYVYYSIKKGGLATLYQVPVLGGQSRKLIEDAVSVTFSPDGNRLGFIRGDGRMLMIANADGTGVQTLAVPTGGERWRGAAWSPDGRVIASGVFSPADNNCRLVEVAVRDGTQKPIPGHPWLHVTGMTWLPDGSGLALSGGDPETKLLQIWLVSYPDGKAQKVTNDLNSYSAVSLTADAKTLATIQGDRSSNIWVAPGGDANLARKITSEIGRDDGLAGLSWTPDGRIVYSARIAGTLDLWIVDQDGSNNRQLTFNARNNYSPSVTPDGRYITFVSDRGGNNNIWRMDLDGSNAKQLTNSLGIAQSPDCSPDSKWVVYQSTHDQKTTIWKVSIDSGEPIQLTNEYSVDPAISPDGKFVACGYGEPRPDAPAKLAIIPFAGGPPARLLDLPNVVRSRMFRWTADGRGLIYRDNRDRVSSLWSQPLDVTSPKQLTDFKSDEIFWFEWSRDGKRLALARGHMGSDVVLINNFR